MEVRFADSNMIAIDCMLTEAEVVQNMLKSRKPEWLVYNVPIDYVNPPLRGDVREYLTNLTEYHPFDN